MEEMCKRAVSARITRAIYHTRKIETTSAVHTRSHPLRKEILIPLDLMVRWWETVFVSFICLDDKWRGLFFPITLLLRQKSFYQIRCNNEGRKCFI